MPLDGLTKQLKADGLSLRLFDRNGQEVVSSTQKGLTPLYQAYRDRPDWFSGGVLVDKVLGKAAAAIAVRGGVRAVHAVLISEPALALLRQGGVTVVYEKKVPAILNRTGEGPCPMEARVYDATDAEEAWAALQRFFIEKEA